MIITKSMGVKSAIFGGLLAICISLGACKSYRDDTKADAEQEAETAAKLVASGDVKEKDLRLPNSREKVEEVSLATPTPTPASDNLSKPLDPAGRPPR